MEEKPQLSYQKSTASQVGIGSLENLSQRVEELPPLPPSQNVEQEQILIDELIRTRPQTREQPIIYPPPEIRTRSSQQYEPILEKIMKEREKQIDELSKKYPTPDHKGEFPFSQQMGKKRSPEHKVSESEILSETPERGVGPQCPYDQGGQMRSGRTQPPVQITSPKKPVQVSPTTQVKTRYEVDMYGKKRVGKTEQKEQRKYRQTHSNQPPPSQPPTGGGAGGHGGGGGGDDDDPSDSDDESDEEENDEDGSEDETSSTQEVPPEELPEELRGQRVFRRRINAGGHDSLRRSGRNPRRGGGGGSPSPSPPPSGAGIPRRRRRRRQPTWVYMIQGPAGPRGLDGRDGRDGTDAPPVTIPPSVQTTAPPVPNLDTSALQHSFDQVGQNMANVLTEQRMTNYRLREQMEANNETMQEQTEAMQTLAEIAKRQSYDHMFAAVPVFDGSQPELFNDWLEQIETLCAMSGRDIRTEVMGKSGPVVQRILKSIPADQRWSVQREEFRRCVSDIPTKGHAAQKLIDLYQEPKENLRAFIHRFSNMHYYATGKTPDVEHDMSHIYRFLSAIKNSKIARRITEQRIPDTMTLQDIFMKALDLEAGMQMAESVAQRRDTQIMEVRNEQIQREEINQMGPRSRSPRSRSPSDAGCWTCGQRGHYHRDCPNRDDKQPVTIPEGVVGQIQHVFTANADITNKMMADLYKQLAAAELKGQMYKRGYRKAKASMAQTNTTTTPVVASSVLTAPAQVQVAAPTQGTHVQTMPLTTAIPVTQMTSQTVPPSLNPVVQLTRIKPDPDPVSSAAYTVVTRAIKIPRGITNAKTYLASAAPSTATTVTTPSTTNVIITPRSSTQSKATKTFKKNFTPNGGRTKQFKKTDGCPPLTTIQEVEAEIETEPQIEITVSDTEADDICQIMADIPTDGECSPSESENEM